MANICFILKKLCGKLPTMFGKAWKRLTRIDRRITTRMEKTGYIVRAGFRYEVLDSRKGHVIAGKKFHFIGAGGIGMSGLAQLLMKNEAIITGSDQCQSCVTDKLCMLGADIKIGHKAENFCEDADSVVISAAITEDNPELAAARQKGCEVFKYAQMLGKLMDCYDGVAIAGTHGKSTTSGWLSYSLRNAGVDASYLVGAEVSQLENSCGVGEEKVFVVEACEYDRSFLNLRPKVACLLNIEADHLDYYRDEDEIVDAFMQFALNTKRDGVVIANGQDANVAKVLSKLGGFVRYETFGLENYCNFCARNIKLVKSYYSFDVYHNGNNLGRVKISLAGEHNVMNALAVIAIAYNLGVDIKKLFEVLPDFTGINRRLMFKDSVNGIVVLDDYAHHPTEIRASLKAIRERYAPKRLFCIFQPHQYSRTRFLLDDFAESFKLCDVVIVPEIYFVRDTLANKQQVNSQVLVDRLRSNGSEAVFIDGFAGICDYLKNNVVSGDLVVTMGAGDVWKVADEYIQWLRRNS